MIATRDGMREAPYRPESGVHCLQAQSRHLDTPTSGNLPLVKADRHLVGPHHFPLAFLPITSVGKPYRGLPKSSRSTRFDRSTDKLSITQHLQILFTLVVLVENLFAIEHVRL